MKRKEKKKAKSKQSKKSLLKEQAQREKKSTKGKVEASVKALWKEVKRLTQELQVKGAEISALKSRQDTEQESTGEDEGRADLPSDWPDAGSISDRKKTWERHQYLCARYEYHLEAGLDKGRARTCADKDLRERYGEDSGYTVEQLDSILS